MAFACEIYLITHSDPVDEEISVTALRATRTAAVIVEELNRHFLEFSVIIKIQNHSLPGDTGIAFNAAI